MATYHEHTEHKHGEMDISHHQSTFAGFVKLSTRVVIISFCVLIFMALTNA